MARKSKHSHPPGHQAIVPDLHLWTDVARTVTPLDPCRPLPAPLSHQPARPTALPTATPAPNGKPQPARTPVQRPAGRPAAPPSGGLDRRTQQRLTRGKMDIDDRIDLHGESGETAHFHLRAFLTRAQARGCRTVLVITGKGESQFARHTLHGREHFHAPERQGRLRRLVTQWFEEPDFRLLVSAYQPAHPRHGGGGAFYVRLRRYGKARPVR